MRLRGARKQQLKNIARPVRLYAVADAAATRPLRSVDLASMKQEIGYVRAPDGVRLAWANVGQGPPLVKTANWLNHLEYDWESSVWHHLIEGLPRDHTLYRYDARGNGLSDWEVPEVSLDAFLRDLETVVDAAGLDRFPLLGISQGAAISVSYAVRHPERVSHLTLYGGFAFGPSKRSSEEKAKREAFATFACVGWENQDSTVRDLFVSQLLPDGTLEQRRLFAEQQRTTTTGECSARYIEAVGNFDVRDLFGQVTTPTLAMHTRGDLICPLEAGRWQTGSRGLASLCCRAATTSSPGTSPRPNAFRGGPAVPRSLAPVQPLPLADAAAQVEALRREVIEQRAPSAHAQLGRAFLNDCSFVRNLRFPD